MLGLRPILRPSPRQPPYPFPFHSSRPLPPRPYSGPLLLLLCPILHGKHCHQRVPELRGKALGVGGQQGQRGYNRAWAGANAIPQPRQENREVLCPSVDWGEFHSPATPEGVRVGLLSCVGWGEFHSPATPKGL